MPNTKTHKPIILIVDDTPENIDVLKGVLIADYQVRPATNGQTALKAVHIRPYPDLILLDIMMPGMDGYEVCRRLKADPITESIPVIFVTAKSEVADELEGLNLGAVDYIIKPFSIPIVLARVKTHLTLRSALLKLDEHNQALLQERELIENMIIKMRKADPFDARYLQYLISPVEVTAGDMLLATFAHDGRQLVLLGDFTGHGLSAAIGGPLVTYLFHSLAKSGALGEQIITEMNNQLCLRLPIGMFFAATLLEITPDRTNATLWNAGLPDTLLIRQGTVHTHFESGMYALGISSKLPVAKATTHFSLQAGDHLYIFSDGILEANNPQNDMFGLVRLEQFLLKVIAEEQVLTDLIPLLDAHVGSCLHDDDITLVEVRV